MLFISNSLLYWRFLRLALYYLKSLACGLIEKKNADSHRRLNAFPTIKLKNRKKKSQSTKLDSSITVYVSWWLLKEIATHNNPIFLVTASAGNFLNNSVSMVPLLLQPSLDRIVVFHLPSWNWKRPSTFYILHLSVFLGRLGRNYLYLIT